MNLDGNESQMNGDITKNRKTKEAPTEQCAVTNRKCEVSLIIILIISPYDTI